MPHQCTSCDRTFPDGSKEMLSGCPGCGGNKFQFLPADAIEEPASGASPAPAEDPSRGDSDIIDADVGDGPDEREDHAQASARRTLVSENELPSSAAVADSDDAGTEETPDLDELRKELDQQFESIKILSPGEYELNLMELYDREEYIVAIEEDGRYVIDVPSVDTER